METSTKNQNEQQKAITSNKRHLSVLVFETELILSQKQERATKSSKRQRTANGNTHQKPKRATKKQQRAFFIPIFIHSHQFWTYGRWLISRAMKSLKEQRRAKKKQRKAAKSYEEQQKATTDIGAGKTKTGKKRPKRATEGTKSPNGNQA